MFKTGDPLTIMISAYDANRIYLNMTSGIPATFEDFGTYLIVNIIRGINNYFEFS